MAPLTTQPPPFPLARKKRIHFIALFSILALAAALRFSNLDALGYANHYYAAAVKSMLQSWHNFIFVAAEPGGSVSVDKPPAGLWIQAASAALFGVNTFGLLLPELAAGLLSVLLIDHLMGRSFGISAGLLAALVLAITPVVVATDRNNTIDSLLILALLLAAWAFILATETGKLRYLLLGALLVGTGFNIKMLQAYLPLPAFFLLYLLGSKEKFGRKLAKSVLAGLVLAVVSLSWAVAVDLTPADQRPYVGSSQDNSVMSLAIGYNGVNRLLGMRFGHPGGPGNRTVGGGFQPPVGFLGPRPGVNGGFPPPSGGGFTRPGGLGGGFPGTGRPGPLRLFIPPLSKEVSWLLPIGLASILLIAARTPLRWPLRVKHQALLLWGGWLLTGGIFFSVAGFFHEYYLAMLAPPLAALVALGVVELWELWKVHPWISVAFLMIIAAITLALQWTTAMAFQASIPWLPVVLVFSALGIGLSIYAADSRDRELAIAAMIATLAALLVTPAIWSALTTLNASANQSLPSAYSGQASGPANRGRLQVDTDLLAYLEANTQPGSYLMAVPSSMQGADYVLATGRPVLYLGGFNGQDPVTSTDDLSQLVAEGRLRYVYWTARGNFGGPGGGSSQGLSSWVSAQCSPVNGFATATRNVGAPDGTGEGGGTAPAFGGGEMQVALYDCGNP